MEIVAAKTLCLGLNLKLISHKHPVVVFTPNLTRKIPSFSHQMRCGTQGFWRRENGRSFTPVAAVVSAAEGVEVSSSRFKDFTVMITSKEEDQELKIPRDILLEVLGPSKVYKEVIKKVINSTVSEYVDKEGLKVIKDLRVEQSFEDLEDAFEPDEKFSFDAVIQLQQTT
uniref:Trigger factor ribosome-binding bacterial domain-containing protein n=1 Tax=Salix viminalis TaxID=40686 RepID=A0A6N2MKE9_SALVM